MGLAGWAAEGMFTPTVLKTLAGTWVTSRTTAAGAGVTGVGAPDGAVFELPSELITTKTTTMTTTRPTDPQARTGPDRRRPGARIGRPCVPPADLPVGLGRLPPRGPAGALVETGRLCALLCALASLASLALRPLPLGGLGVLPPTGGAPPFVRRLSSVATVLSVLVVGAGWGRRR